ncbi:MAG: hypothetical protein CYG61_02695 [Actinobacteria bacterium]|nr:MAG: hypothetical protein CYG61_02695 [Actinomycetota bacterium]
MVVEAITREMTFEGHLPVSVEVTEPGTIGKLPTTGFPIGDLVAVAVGLVVFGFLLAAVARPLKKKGTNMSKRRVLCGVAALGLLAAIAAPARAGEVVVAVDNPGGSRTLYVEDLAGNELTGLNFGTTRSLPFRVRVVDTTMDRSGFSVSATMTNLYVDDSGTIDYAKKIDSAKLSISNTADPLNVLEVSASVRPAVDTVSTISDLLICQTLGLVTSIVNGSQVCQISATGLVGNVQSAVPVTVTLSDLTNLPLLPQAAEAGAFTDPDYAGVGANDPDKPSSFTPTPRRMLAGSVVSTDAVLSALKGALDTDPRSELISDTTIINGLSAAVANWELLTTAQVTTVLAGTVATVENLVPEQVRAQTGTYLSFPALNVDVPTTAAKGNYKGTLVVTALQS